MREENKNEENLKQAPEAVPNENAETPKEPERQAESASEAAAPKAEAPAAAAEQAEAQAPAEPEPAAAPAARAAPTAEPEAPAEAAAPAAPAAPAAAQADAPKAETSAAPAEGAGDEAPRRKETDEEKAARRKAAFEARQAAKAAAAQAKADEERAAAAAVTAGAAAPGAAPASGEAPAAGAAPAGAKAPAAAEAEAPPPKPPSPNQPRLNRAVELLRELVAADAVDEAYINEPNDHLPTIVMKSEHWAQAASLFRDHEELGCDYLRNVTGVDYETHMEVVYYPLNMQRRENYCIKVRTDREQPSVPSATRVWETANWNEREIYDLLGIDFPGHPNMTRIMMPDDWVGHPLRKDYVPLDPEV